MPYTSFIDGGPGLDWRGKIALILADILHKQNPAYVCGIRKSGLDKNTIDSITEDPRVHGMVEGDELLNIFLYGNEDSAGRYARDLYHNIQKHVGIAGTNTANLEHFALREEAINIKWKLHYSIDYAEKNKLPYCSYDPKKMD